VIDALLINQPSVFSTNVGTRINAYVQVYPVLSLACLAAVLRQGGFSVSILDLGMESEPFHVLDRTLGELRPRVVGVTSTTPLFFEAVQISRIVRERLGEEVNVVLGGPHGSALPEECLEASDFDIVAVGEGEGTIVEIVAGRPLSDIRGIYYKEGEEILSTPPREFIKDLDALPFPALDLFDIKRYKCSRLVARKTPMSNMMTSRGCPFNCSFCGKKTFAREFRPKSPERVIDEFKHMLGLGYQEIRIADDQFTSNMTRAKTICEMILKEGLDFPWNLASGLRVDCVDEEFLALAKRAGLYQVSIGFESGDQECLNSIDKGITLEQSIRCMEMVRKSGLESVGFFMLGLPAETEESMKRTIDFAIKLMPDFAKTTVTIPLPDARLFWGYEAKGLIKSRDWSQYKLHGAGTVYQHPNPDLTHEKMQKYYDLFYRRFYLNPRYLARRAKISLSRGTLFDDLYYGLQTFFPRLFGARPISD